MLEAFKLKPFDLEPIYASWPNAPVFSGKPKKDMPIDEWLDKIKQGCKERNVPKEYWYKVAQRYMGPQAKARFEQLKIVMTQMHGGKYRWNWKKFKVAMRNMGWTIDAKAAETVKVHAKRSGFWWITKKGENDTEVELPVTPAVSKPPPKLQRSQTLTGTLKRRWTAPGKEHAPPPSTPLPPPPPAFSFFWNNTRKASLDDFTNSSKRPSLHQKAVSDSIISRDSDTAVTIAQAPIWLVNACTALDYLQTEHPKVMTTIAAILITAGSIPTIPAIAAGAGGAVLASSAVQAAGAIAVGLGTLIKTHQEVVNSTGSGSSGNGHH